MMEWTDRHCRFFHRLLTRRALLYTEMITTGAVLRGDRARLLGFDPAEHPVAVQLGGSDPRALAECARICANLGYDEINLNVGCPSDRVREGRFGACLMAEPALVGACVAAMKAAVNIPVTVKCRIGIDDRDRWDFLRDFVAAIAEAGVSVGWQQVKSNTSVSSSDSSANSYGSSGTATFDSRRCRAVSLLRRSARLRHAA